MTGGKQLLFAGLAAGLSLVVGLGLVLAVDLHLHRRYEAVAGVNARGYRGPLVGRKLSGERRLVVLGGSTAQGFGVPWEESFPAVLERILNDQRRRRGEGPVSVVNLAGNAEGAYAFKYNLRAYRRLDYDAAIFYTGYNDLGEGLNTKAFRRDSPVFRLTGYMPIFPLVLSEKAMALRYGGNVEAAYRGQKTVFQPNPMRRAGAGILKAAIQVNRSLEEQLGHLTRRPSDEEFARLSSPDGCGKGWAFYCEQVYSAVRMALDDGRRVIVVTQPYISDAHVKQQQAMAGMLREEFGLSPRLRLVNLGLAVDLKDPALAFDGMHLTVKGNARIADALAPGVLEVLRDEH